MSATNTARLDRIVGAYLECAGWADCGPDEDTNGADFAEAMEAEAREDCAAFLAIVERIEAQEPGLAAAMPDDESIGHDFWLTRNRHGAGFWDRGLGALGCRLTDEAHRFGERSVYLGDDGLLYAG